MGLHVVVVGSPFEGLRVIGPFNNGEAAHEWANQHINNEGWWAEDWWAVALNSPEEG